MNDISDQDFQGEPLDLTKYLYLDAADAIIIAASDGDGRLVDYLIAAGHDINLRDENGCTALFRSVDETYFSLAIHLLKLGADPNIPNNEGDTPLDIAKYSQLHKSNNDSEMVEALVKFGGLCKSGPSARELLDDKIYEGFAQANAIKNLLSLIEKNKK